MRTIGPDEGQIGKGYLDCTRFRAVGLVQTTPPRPRNREPGLVPGFFLPESNPLNDRPTSESGRWAIIGSNDHKWREAVVAVLGFRRTMFDHVVFGVSDYAASKAFFLKALEPLGVAIASEGPLGVELCCPDSNASLCIRRVEEAATHLHLAFKAVNRGQVESFYRAAIEAGAKDNGAPGLRPQYHSNYYAAFVIGPDGHNIEVVCHEPEA